MVAKYCVAKFKRLTFSISDYDLIYTNNLDLLNSSRFFLLTNMISLCNNCKSFLGLRLSST